MIDAILRRVALDALVAAVRSSDPRARRVAVEHFWDIQYILRFGLPRLPDPELRIPPRPEPDPPPFERLAAHEEILSALIDLQLGDPEPEPNVVGMLRDPAVRLSAAKNLSVRLQSAIRQVRQEIETLGGAAAGSQSS